MITARIERERAAVIKLLKEDNIPDTNKPNWNKQDKTLYYEGNVVKRFSRIAVNQFLVLDGFEELGWPMELDSPLTGGGNRDPVTMTQDTAKNLNDRRESESIKFSTNGRGTGFSWSAL